MDKKRYYISVATGEIVDNPTITTYQFIIEANEAEIHQLQELYDEAHALEMDTMVRGMTPAIAYHDDPQNHEYDQALMRIYRMLHQLGTTETKNHIETMGVL